MRLREIVGAVDADVAHRRERRDPARADRRCDRAEQRDEHADDHRDDEPGRLDPQGAGGDADARARQDRQDQLGQGDAADVADQRTADADDERLDEQRSGHLAATGTDRPQQRVLLLSLRRRDAEHVEDDEAADEDGDQGEDRQEQRQEAEALLDVALVLLGDLLAGEHLDVLVAGLLQALLDAVGQLLLAQRAVAADDDRVDEAGLAVDERLRGRQVEQRPRRAAGVSLPAKRRRCR